MSVPLLYLLQMHEVRKQSLPAKKWQYSSAEVLAVQERRVLMDLQKSFWLYSKLWDKMGQAE
jgi:hypothetical protein